MAEHNYIWDNIADAQRRLEGGVVLYKGEPVYISNVRGLNRNQIAVIYSLPYRMYEGTPQEVPINPEHFEIRELPALGYVNYKPGIVPYLRRQSVRNQFQCFHQNNIDVQHGEGKTMLTLLGTDGFKDMLLGKYPKLKETFEELLEAEDPTRKAVSKRICLVLDDMDSISIEYRGTPVARATKPKKTGALFILADKYHFLREELTEQGIQLEAA